MIGETSKCYRCKHRYSGRHCFAFPFPEEIPNDIFFEGKEHNKVIEGQNKDYVFEAGESPQKFYTETELRKLGVID